MSPGTSSSVLQRLSVLASTVTATSLTIRDDVVSLREVFADQLQTGAHLSTWKVGDYYTNPCGGVWKGVTCDMRSGKPRVKTLVLEQVGLPGTLNLTALRTLNALEKFQILQSNLTGSLDLRNLPPKLVVFDVWNNQLSGGVDLTTLPSTLTEIDLDENALSGPVDFTQLPKGLKQVYLAYNKFSGTVNLTSLPVEMLDLTIHENQFTGSLDLSQLPMKLQHMDFQNNGFTGTLKLRDLPSTLVSLIANKNFFSNFHLPSTIPDGIENLQIQPRGTWGDSHCFVGRLDTSNLELNMCDLPLLASQPQCPEEAEESSTQGEGDDEETSSLPLYLSIVCGCLTLCSMLCILVALRDQRTDVKDSALRQTLDDDADDADEDAGDERDGDDKDDCRSPDEDEDGGMRPEAASMSGSSHSCHS